MQDRIQGILRSSPWLRAGVLATLLVATGAPTNAGEGAPPVVATPAGTRYSVTHALFGDPDGPGPQSAQCIRIFNPNLSGAPDDIVLFDGADETLRTDVFGTIATIAEAVAVEQDGVFRLTINTFSPPGTDLFPAGLTNSVGQPYVNGCFSVGIDDLLDWPGLDTVLAALITLRKYVEPMCEGGAAAGQVCTSNTDCPGGFCSNRGQIIQGPTNITQQLNPWLGQFNRILTNAAGKGINQVELELLVRKSGNPPTSDDCFNAFPVSTGNTSFSTVGASTDGPNEPEACAVNGSSQIDADIWYQHTSQCTGDLTVSLCDSFFDTRLAIYEGCTGCPPGVPPLGCNDDTDFCGPLGEQSKLTVSAVAGHCYLLRVGGFRGDQGPGTMSVSCARGACCSEGVCTDGLNRSVCEAGEGIWFSNRACGGFTCPAPPPPNDECDNAIPLVTGIPFDGTTLGAEGSDMSSCGLDGDTADAWHTWTADCTGRTRISLCDSTFDTTLALFDTCGGTEIACSDDDCSATRSQLFLSVSQGQQLVMRVAGFNGARGAYQIVVDPCTPEPQACCLSNGGCANAIPTICLQNNGTPRGPGSTCRGDFNFNGVDDGCEPCPPAFIAESKPGDEAIDARQPHPAADSVLHQGIGSADDPIVLTLLPVTPNVPACFQLCESAGEDNVGSNDIAEVVSLPGGKYRIVLVRPITQYAVTTIEYLGGGDFVQFTSHPANVNADEVSDALDLDALINCCLDATCVPPNGFLSCDIDRSGTWTPADIITLADILNGAESFTRYLDSLLPGAGNCP